MREGMYIIFLFDSKIQTVEMRQWVPGLGFESIYTHSFALGQGHLVSLLCQILSPDQQTDFLGPIRARLLSAAVDGLSDGQRHTKGDRLQVLQGET